VVDRLTLLRNATLLVELAGLRLLVDPALDAAGARPPVEDTPAPRPNPLVELPAAADDALRDLDALIVTHLHRDHFDDAAAERLPKGIPVLCQPPDVESLEERGFRDVRPVDTEARLGDLRVHRTPACHCLDPAIREALGPGSGYVLDAGRARLYVAGDSVWSDPVAAALEEHRPDVVIVNSGAARFLTGPPISMTAEDVIATARARPDARVVAVHLEAINHCLLSRAELARALREAGVDAEVPADGETLMLD
jgi:L-ascorbate metabolism protein UlaG (beta-lactamase superfamily)